MNTKVQGAMLLLSSIIISSVLTHLLTKAKYEKRKVIAAPEVQEEPKKESKPKTKMGDEINLTNSQEKIDVTKYAEKYKRQNDALVRDYTPDPSEHPTIEIIDCDIFDSNEAYDAVTFTLYADGVLVNEQGKIVTDYENNVGTRAVERFNELEHDGAVYVRNNKHEMDYEILRDLRSYNEATGGHANGRS